MTEIKSFILQWWGIVWIAERILRCLLCHCFAELGCLHCCGMKVPKTAIEIRKALIFLESTAGHLRPVLLVKNLRSENSDFIKMCKNEGSDVWNIVSHRKLILPAIVCKYNIEILQWTVYSATCSSSCTQGVSWTYKGHLEEVMDVFWASYVRPISVLCPVNGPFNIPTLITSAGNNPK